LIAGLYDVSTGKASFETELSSVSLPAPKAISPDASSTPKPVVTPTAAPAKSEAVASKAVAKPESKKAPASPDGTKPAAKKSLDSASFARRTR
jgi:hypothetical protein